MAATLAGFTVIEAVNVTVAFFRTGLAELLTAVALAAFTTSVTGAEVLASFNASPR